MFKPHRSMALMNYDLVKFWYKFISCLGFKNRVKSVHRLSLNMIGFVDWFSSK